MKKRVVVLVAIVVIVISVLGLTTLGQAQNSGDLLYLPIIQNGYEAPPLFNNQMVDLYFDENLPIEDWDTWQYLDPIPHVVELNPYIIYIPPPGYLVTNAMRYTYEDSIYHWFGNGTVGQWNCVKSFTFEEDGPINFIGGEWCFKTTEAYPFAFGYASYELRNTSPFTTDVIMFLVKVDPYYCETCIPGKPPLPTPTPDPTE